MNNIRPRMAVWCCPTQHHDTCREKALDERQIPWLSPHKTNTFPTNKTYPFL
ncbi:hypothetical protein QWZ16_12125 [Vibrio ostreicida]|uniref:Uncharacterized protein n=1 Tax=Vibrio ostreicida TaxID=526588 RepID=A0ABT8BTG1_9VIBR|nr:hypothetical protein [Vibrio ostreicida]MDN3610451.1 hypothetical protein [Vibrio ostreicida]